ncbi:MAG: hypothetical protein E7659_07590 [Ruminococcaceae bacterium]|nr:hypothetical protein [Oscillospiraceae bacterium]
MNQQKIKVLSWVLALMLCAALMSGCINLKEGDFPTTPPDLESTSTDTPEDTTPQVTIPAVTTEQTPPEDTTPDGITSSTPDESTEVTPPKDTTPPETSTEEDPTPGTTPPPETTTEDPNEPPKPDDKIKIYIDQGHNPFLPKEDPTEPNKGWNTGASNKELGLYEQDLTYEIGILLAELLAQDDRFEVRLSRPTADTILGTDNDSALDFRINDAAEWGADYFISLHINSYTDPSIDGIEVYTATAEGEQYELGKKLLNGLLASTQLDNRGMKNGANLRVLKNATMPAVLVEMGFISNTKDATLLDESPELFAQGIYDGIQAYFNALEAETLTE